MKGHGERDSSSTPVSPSIFGCIRFIRSKTLLNLPLKESAFSGPFFFGSLTIEESEISACGTPDEGVLQTQMVVDVKMTIAV